MQAQIGWKRASALSENTEQADDFQLTFKFFFRNLKNLTQNKHPLQLTQTHGKQAIFQQEVWLQQAIGNSMRSSVKTVRKKNFS